MLLTTIFTTYIAFTLLEFQMCSTDMCEHIERIEKMPFVILLYTVFFTLDI